MAETIRSFADSRTTRVIPRVGTGLTRALYATYVSFLPTESFAYPLVTKHGDPRGVFRGDAEDAGCSGQFSFFTAHPGVTRGGHYHHSKTEKFLVFKGQARFGFRHIVTGETPRARPYRASESRSRRNRAGLGARRHERRSRRDGRHAVGQRDLRSGAADTVSARARLTVSRPHTRGTAR